MLLPDLTRRALILALGAATAPPPKPSHAATDGLSQLRAAQQTLVRVDGLLTERGSWPEAQRLLNTLDDGVLTKALEAAVDPKSVKDIAMDQAAFIVYYEEVRYNDKRLEPQTPVREGSNPGAGTPRHQTALPKPYSHLCAAPWPERARRAERQEEGVPARACGRACGAELSAQARRRRRRLAQVLGGEHAIVDGVSGPRVERQAQVSFTAVPRVSTYVPFGQG